MCNVEVSFGPAISKVICLTHHHFNCCVCQQRSFMNLLPQIPEWKSKSGWRPTLLWLTSPGAVRRPYHGASVGGGKCGLRRSPEAKEKEWQMAPSNAG